MLPVSWTGRWSRWLVPICQLALVVSPYWCHLYCTGSQAAGQYRCAQPLYLMWSTSCQCVRTLLCVSQFMVDLRHVQLFLFPSPCRCFAPRFPPSGKHCANWPGLQSRAHVALRVRGKVGQDMSPGVHGLGHCVASGTRRWPRPHSLPDQPRRWAGGHCRWAADLLLLLLREREREFVYNAKFFTMVLGGMYRSSEPWGKVLSCTLCAQRAPSFQWYYCIGKVMLWTWWHHFSVALCTDAINNAHAIISLEQLFLAT